MNETREATDIIKTYEGCILLRLNDLPGENTAGWEGAGLEDVGLGRCRAGIQPGEVTGVLPVLEQPAPVGFNL